MNKLIKILEGSAAIEAYYQDVVNCPDEKWDSTGKVPKWSYETCKYHFSGGVILVFENEVPDFDGGRKLKYLGHSNYIACPRLFTDEEKKAAIERWQRLVNQLPTDWEDWAEFLINGRYDCDPFGQSPLLSTHDCDEFQKVFKRLWLNKWSAVSSACLKPLVEDENGSLTLPKEVIKSGNIFIRHFDKQLSKNEYRYRVYMCCMDAAAYCGFIEHQTLSQN